VSGTAVVVGAGVFGASTARELRRRGWNVTVLEQHAPGHVGSGSGGDTRLMRLAHGDVEWYTRSAQRSLELWRELEAESGQQLFEPIGIAWFDSGTGEFTRRTETTFARLGIPCERLTPDEARGLYPSLGGDDLRGVLLEPEAGVLYARAATRLLAAELDVEPSRADPAYPPQADVVVWACGAWLPKLFPELVEQTIVRRDVFFFSVPGEWSGTPGFCDYDSAYYGHGELAGLGMKVAPDSGRDEIDPDTVERLPLAANEQLARDYLARRFPSLAHARLAGTRVCQYDLTLDTHFLVAAHPERTGWWLLGGGSGHGFKHGPALGEYVADCIEGRREPMAFHGLGPRTGHAGLRTAEVF
jgi:glycine/D-amino acid oxidase-like deaminating enzyme